LNKETLLFESLGDLEGKRKLSSKQLYELMREAGPSTVAELVKLTDTSEKTVRTYLKELDEQGLAGFEIKDRGRRPLQAGLAAGAGSSSTCLGRERFYVPGQGTGTDMHGYT